MFDVQPKPYTMMWIVNGVVVNALGWQLSCSDLKQGLLPCFFFAGLCRKPEDIDAR
jgi:hypothetical protein